MRSGNNLALFSNNPALFSNNPALFSNNPALFDNNPPLFSNNPLCSRPSYPSYLGFCSSPSISIERSSRPCFLPLVVTHRLVHVMPSMRSRNMVLSRGFIWLAAASCVVIRGEEVAMILCPMSFIGDFNHNENGVIT